MVSISLVGPFTIEQWCCCGFICEVCLQVD